jgi:hypothetical protein
VPPGRAWYSLLHAACSAQLPIACRGQPDDCGAPGVISGLSYCICVRMVRRPVSSGITKREGRQNSQEVCPFNNSKFVQIRREAAFWPGEGVQGERSEYPRDPSALPNGRAD